MIGWLGDSQRKLDHQKEIFKYKDLVLSNAQQVLDIHPPHNSNYSLELFCNYAKLSNMYL